MSYTKKFTINRVGADVDEARIVAWAVAPGAAFRAGDILLEIETDKSVIEIPADEDGTMRAHLYSQGDTVDFETPVAELEVEGEPPEQEEQAAPEAGVESASDASAASRPPSGAPTGWGGEAGTGTDADTSAPAAYRPQPDSGTGRIVATPAARAMAEESGADLSRITGTGPNGRITRVDVAAVLCGGAVGAASASARSGSAGTGLVSSRHGEIHVRAWAPRRSEAAPDAPEAVLLHGMFGDIDTWAATASSLSRAGLGVTALDLPGHGNSPSNASSVEQVVDAVTEVLQERVPGPVALIGHSFGAAVAARVAGRLGERLRSLVMLAPVGLGTEISQSFLDGMINARTEEALARELRKLTETFTNLSGPYLRTLQARLHERSLVLNALCAALSHNGVQQIDITGDLVRLGSPVTIIQGRNDGIVPWQNILNAPPRAALHVLPGVGHMPHWEAPTLALDIMLDALVPRA